MASFDWDAAWVITSINASAIADAASAVTAAIDNDTKLATRVSVEIAYGATVNEGVKVYVLANIDDTLFEDTVDDPFSFEMPSAVSATRVRAFAVPGTIDQFKIKLTNDSGAQVTATVRTKQAVV